jgi:hypothetical protein
MTYDETVKLSNEWMRRFIETPEEFAHQFQSMTAFLKDEAEGREPSYGELCAAYIFSLQDETKAAPVAGRNPNRVS